MSNEQTNQDVIPESKKGFFNKFPGQFWLVVMFEFFERGSYYGIMSFLSQYFVESLHFPKENVGVIKGVIQPLLYFLPIIAGAMADRFGYRKVLMVAFSLLGTGYFLTSQMTSYTAVFAALVVMGFGAGTFKPIISGTIAKLTDESNSTQAFGIFYWSINMGAFLFPLALVPFLKSINPSYVIIASGICTSIMIIPTALFFKEPAKRKQIDDNIKEREKKGLIQTVANAFEIIYSPIVLLYDLMKKSTISRLVVSLVLIALLGFSVYNYSLPPKVSEKYPAIGIEMGQKTIIFQVKRDMSGKKDAYKLAPDKDNKTQINLTVFKPDYVNEFSPRLIQEISALINDSTINKEDITRYINQSDKKMELTFELAPSLSTPFQITDISNTNAGNAQGSTGAYAFKVSLKSLKDYPAYKNDLLQAMHKNPPLRGVTPKDSDTLIESMNTRPFFLFFVITVILVGLFITSISSRRTQVKIENNPQTQAKLPMFVVPLIIVMTWLLPGLTTLGKIICTVIYLSVMSLFIIDKTDTRKFVDHSKFLLMIVLYSGFWVLYFQMFDSVLWYVQAYVDASPLNSAVNSFLGLFGVKIDWFFDVEHVTVINAATIILLQLLISSIVKNKKAMPTMITGIAIATLGMAVLSLSTHIWVFIIGIFIFSIGEMTAHPKFISYVGLTAPSDRKAMYMGYIFLYGVFGSSVGGVVGSKLYVHFVDNLNKPRTLWLIFSMIGVITIISLLLYNKFLVPKTSEASK